MEPADHSQVHGPHFLLLPFVEHGHINPMLHLASQLSSDPNFHCNVTFVNATPPALAAAGLFPHTQASSTVSAPASNCISTAEPPAAPIINGTSSQLRDSLVLHHDPLLGHSLQFVTIKAPALGATSAETRPGPETKQLDYVSMSSRNIVFKQKLAALEAQQPLIEKILLEFKASGNPISCIICDVLLWKWVRKVAEKHGARLACLLPGALVFFASTSIQSGKEDELEELLVLSFHMPGKDDGRRLGLCNIRDPPDIRKQKYKSFSSLLEGLEHAGAPILVNSFRKLDEPLLPLLEASGLNVKFIGPLIHAPWRGDVGVANRMTKLAGSELVQQEWCLEWLNKQEPRSVLYISFGSEAVLEAAQVEEIAMGIENSG